MLSKEILYSIREEFIISEMNVLDFVEELENNNSYNEEECEEIEEFLNNSCS